MWDFKSKIPISSDLVMGNLNLCVHVGEEWTGGCSKNLGWPIIRGDRPIELESSWFSTKVILVMRLIFIELLLLLINIRINYIGLGRKVLTQEGNNPEKS